MFTRKRLPPYTPSGDWKKDGPALVKWLSDYLQGLEQKNSLTLSQAQIYVDQGLQFPATQVASSDPNNLDDYAEGTWTPTDGSGAGLTLTVTTAKYTKIGRIVVAQMHVTYPATANTASTQINGLPFASSGIHVMTVYSNSATAIAAAQVSGTVINMFKTGNVAVTNANVSANFVIMSFAYHT